MCHSCHPRLGQKTDGKSSSLSLHMGLQVARTWEVAFSQRLHCFDFSLLWGAAVPPDHSTLCLLSPKLGRKDQWETQTKHLSASKTLFPLKSNLGQVQVTQQREIMWRTISLYFASLVLKMIWNQKKTGEEKIGNAVNPSQVGGRGGFEGGRGVHATCLMTSYCLHPLQPHHISYKSIKSSNSKNLLILPTVMMKQTQNSYFLLHGTKDSLKSW